MQFAKVDSFAIYAAEKKLAARGIVVPRQLLIDQYLIQGQLRTTVRHLIDAPPATPISHSFAKAIIEGPNESKNPKFIAPVRTGILYSALILALAGLEVALRVHNNQLSGKLSDWLIPGLIVVLLVAASMGYTFLGSRYGP